MSSNRSKAKICHRKIQRNPYRPVEGRFSSLLGFPPAQVEIFSGTPAQECSKMLPSWACSQKAWNERIVNFTNLRGKQVENRGKVAFQELIVVNFELFAFEKIAGLGTRPLLYIMLPLELL